MGLRYRSMLAAACMAAASAVCQAGGFSVSPVRLHLGERDRAVALRLGNEGTQELRLRAELQAWTQDEDGQDRLQPSDDLVVSPPFLRVPAQGEQVVRLILAVPRDPTRQMTYRLLLREERTPGQDAAAGIPIALVLSLPVFITPASARHALHCQARLNDGAAAQVECRNPGQAHARVVRLDLLEGGRVVGRHEGSVYLLPGARSRIPLALESGATAASALTLRAQLDSGEWLSGSTVAEEPTTARSTPGPTAAASPSPAPTPTP